MFTICCDKCGSELMIDHQATFDEYMKDADYLIDDIEKIAESSLQQYLIYKCGLCGESYKFKYEDWEKRYRKAIAEEVMETRKHDLFKSFNLSTISADNGMSYCGQCSGYDGDGYCLNDIIKQCTIRKRDV